MTPTTWADVANNAVTMIGVVAIAWGFAWMMK